MTYMKVVWRHKFESEPVEILSELDAQRTEVRKVEKFRDGALSFAGPAGLSGSSVLSETRVPPISEIAVDPQFLPSEIDRDTFESAWRSATIAVAA